MKLLLLASLLIGNVYSQERVPCAQIATFGDTDAAKIERCEIAISSEACGCTFVPESGETCSSAECEPTPQPTASVTAGCDCDGDEDTEGRRRILRRLLSSDSGSADSGDECNCGDSSDSGGDSDDGDDGDDGDDDEDEQEDGEVEEEEVEEEEEENTNTEVDTDTTTTTTTTPAPTLNTAAVFNGDTNSDTDTNQLQQPTPVGFIREEVDPQGVEEAPNQEMAGSARGSNIMCAVMAALFFAFL